VCPEGTGRAAKKYPNAINKSKLGTLPCPPPSYPGWCFLDLNGSNRELHPQTSLQNQVQESSCCLGTGRKPQSFLYIASFMALNRGHDVFTETHDNYTSSLQYQSHVQAYSYYTLGGASWLHPPVLCKFFHSRASTQQRVTKLGVSIFGPVTWETGL
jgi:hypothetical protein